MFCNSRCSRQKIANLRDKNFQIRNHQREEILFVPRTLMTSIFEGQPPKTKPFSNENKGHLGSRVALLAL